MKTVLDLISEFGALNDTKLRSGGSLPPEDEGRWAELKTFYELMMSREGLPLPQETPRFSAGDIRERLGDRERIRVPVETPIVFEHQSRGGVFVASEILVDAGSLLTLYLAGIGGDEEDLLEATGEVVWRTKRGVPEADLPRGMGIRFVDFPEAAMERLDSYVVDTIAKRISALW